jgi:hypothetical protein
MGVLDISSYVCKNQYLHMKNVRLKTIGSLGFAKGHRAKGDSNALVIASAHKVSKGIVTFHGQLKTHCRFLSPVYDIREETPQPFLQA